MPEPSPDLSSRYQQALREFLTDGGELPLHKAYEFGRQALQSGVGILELVSVHAHATMNIVNGRELSAAELSSRLQAAGRFLVETLSPFEMVQLGNQEANAALKRLNAILEEEAKRIAHVLHDEAAQLLASVYLELAEILRESTPPISARVDKITAQLDMVREQLRRLSHELRPPILDQLGLMPALEFLAGGYRKRAGLEVEILGQLEGRPPPTVETAFYRAVQEALNNVVRHAHAKRVLIRTWHEDGVVHCSIRDDGSGFEPGAPNAKVGVRGLGLIGIQERVASLYGALEIDSSPAAGTELHISIPLGSNS